MHTAGRAGQGRFAIPPPGCLLINCAPDCVVAVDGDAGVRKGRSRSRGGGKGPHTQIVGMPDTANVAERFTPARVLSHGLSLNRVLSCCQAVVDTLQLGQLFHLFPVPTNSSPSASSCLADHATLWHVHAYVVQGIVIGAGVHGRVYKGVHRETGRTVALKKVCYGYGIRSVTLDKYFRIATRAFNAREPDHVSEGLTAFHPGWLGVELEGGATHAALRSLLRTGKEQIYTLLGINKILGA